MAEDAMARAGTSRRTGSGRKLCAAQVLSRSCKATMFQRVHFGGNAIAIFRGWTIVAAIAATLRHLATDCSRSKGNSLSREPTAKRLKQVSRIEVLRAESPWH